MEQKATPSQRLFIVKKWVELTLLREEISRNKKGRPWVLRSDPRLARLSDLQVSRYTAKASPQSRSYRKLQQCGHGQIAKQRIPPRQISGSGSLA